jgi:hypothetical protein
MKALRPLVIVLLALGALFYLAGILWAGVLSLQSNTVPELPEVVTYVITTIGGVLATNFGAVFGISVVPNGGKKAEQLNMFSLLAPPASRTKVDKLQIIAAYLYIVSLLLALIFWLVDGLSDTSAPVLSTMTFTLIGVIGGLGAVVLGAQSEPDAGTQAG